jgi:hypothetical protein
MTQAFNLSQLANNVNTSGLLNAAAGLYNQTPVANGGTGKASVTSGTLLLGAGTAAMTELTGGTVGNVVTWNGSAWGSASGAGGAAPVLNVYTTPGTWTKPATVKAISVTVVGGGGNGGTATPNGVPTSNSVLAAGGGGGGSAIRLYPAPSIPGPQPYTVGGVSASSAFGGTVTVITGTGGSAGSGANSPVWVAGGAAGTGSGGNINNGGSSGGPSINANPSGVSGAGGDSFFGGGGSGRVGAAPSFQTGGAGTSYGAGGGGGLRQGTTSPGTPGPISGGAGVQGVVIIEEFY